MVKSWSKIWPLSTPPATGSHHISLRDRTHGMKCPCLTRELIMLSIVVATGMTATYCIQLETVLRREASSAVAIYCFGPQKSAFISNLIYRIVIDITQLRCPQLADISLPTISCTFACHKFKHACALQSAYSISQWLRFHILSPVYKVSASTYMSLMFFRCGRYWNTSTSSTSRGQNTSAYCWMRPSSRT